MFQMTENGLINQIRIIRDTGFLNVAQIQTIRESLCSGKNLEENNVYVDQRMCKQCGIVLEERLSNQNDVDKPEIR